MRKLNKREFIILMICLVLVLIFGISKFVAFINEEGGGINDRIVLAQHKLNKNLQIIQSGSLVDKQYDQLAGLLGKPSSEWAEFSGIISKVEELAKEVNIHVGDLQPQTVFDRDNVRAFPLKLEIDGTWPNIVKFLYLLQAQPNMFNIQELNLEKFSESALHGRLVLSRLRAIP